MKSIATLIATMVATASFAAEPAKAPVAPAAPAPAVTAAAPAKAEAPKDLVLAKKKEDKAAHKADTKSQAKPAEKAEASKK
jgi:hypothetical protein